jgi:hypothetical protein
MAKKPKDPGPSQADIAQVQVSQARWNHYVAQYRPAEAAMVARSEFTAGERNRVRGEVAADTAGAFGGLNRKTIAAGNQAGDKTGSGSALMALAGNAEAQGGAQGLGKGAATLGGKLQSESEKFRVTQVGQGVVSGIQSDLSQAARRQTAVANQKAFLKAQVQNAKIAAAATVAGAGVRKYKGHLDAQAEEKLAAAREANTDLMGGGTGAPNFAANFAPQPFGGITNPMQSSHLNFLGSGTDLSSRMTYRHPLEGL